MTLKPLPAICGETSWSRTFLLQGIPESQPLDLYVNQPSAASLYVQINHAPIDMIIYLLLKHLCWVVEHLVSIGKVLGSFSNTGKNNLQLAVYLAL
jgi:hypothetical protein